MKSIFFSILVVIFSIVSGYSQGLTIIEQDYDLALVESKKQNKLLLIEFYFMGCGPCKELDNKVFKNPAISNKIGKSFVLLRYDFEKPAKYRLEIKHFVSAFPTTIVLNQDQLVFHKISGVSDKDVVKDFLLALDEAILKVSKNEYLKGVSPSPNLVYPKILENYGRKQSKNLDETEIKNGIRNLDETEIKNFWATTNDNFSEVSFVMIYLLYYEMPDEIKSFFLANKSKYEELFGKEDVLYLKDRIIKESFWKALIDTDRAKFALAVQWAKENYDAAQAKRLVGNFEKMMLEQERIKARKTARAKRHKKSK